LNKSKLILKKNEKMIILFEEEPVTSTGKELAKINRTILAQDDRKHTLKEKKKKKTIISIEHIKGSYILISITWEGIFDRQLFQYGPGDCVECLPLKFNKYGCLTLKLYQLKHDEKRQDDEESQDDDTGLYKELSYSGLDKNCIRVKIELTDKNNVFAKRLVDPENGDRLHVRHPEFDKKGFLGFTMSIIPKPREVFVKRMATLRGISR
jgi:hypothetical protein